MSRVRAYKQSAVEHYLKLLEWWSKELELCWRQKRLVLLRQRKAVKAAVAGMVVEGARVVLAAEKAGAVAAMQLMEAASAGMVVKGAGLGLAAETAAAVAA